MNVPIAIVLATVVGFLVGGCGSAGNVAHRTTWPGDTTHSFQIGWYSDGQSRPGRLNEYQRSGVTLVVARYGKNANTDQWLRSAADHHIQVLLQPKFSWIRNGNIDKLRAFVRRYRHYPAVFGWYLYDEPDREGLPPARLIAAYSAVKALDHRPVAVVFTTGQCRFGAAAIDPGYVSGFDLLMFDRYPFYVNMAGFRPLADARKVDKTCASTARQNHKLGPIMVLQAFGRGLTDGPFVWRDPTYRESACEFRIAVRAGVTGVLFYSDHLADPQVWKNTQRIVQDWNSHRGRLSELGSRLIQC